MHVVGVVIRIRADPYPRVVEGQHWNNDADGRTHDDITTIYGPIPHSSGKIERLSCVHDHARMRREHAEAVAPRRIVVVVVIARVAELLAVKFTLAKFVSAAITA